MLAVLVSIVMSCNRNSDINNQLNEAEIVIVDYPDSALSILKRIDKSTLKSKAEQARYGLLMSQALDKNYIDTTSFDILQPAIDYYLDKGTPDEKLKTLYYQGRIFQNRHNLDSAMNCFLNAVEWRQQATDTLAIANLLVAQGTINHQTYKFDKFIQNNIEAADLYRTIGKQDYALLSYCNAIDASILEHDKSKADSIFSIVTPIISDNPDFESEIFPYRISYTIVFGNEENLRDIINNQISSGDLDDFTKLDIAAALLEIGDSRKAKIYLDSIASDSYAKKSLKYLAVRPNVLEMIGDYPGALSAYKDFSNEIDSIHNAIFSSDLLFAEKRHELEIKNLRQIHYKDKIIWWSISSLLVLLIITVVTYYLYRIGKMKRLLVEKEQSRLQLENDNLQKQNTVLELEKQASELESEKQKLAAANMRLHISQLEAENEHLKKLSEKEDLPSDIRNVIKERIEKMNVLFAARILEKDADVLEYNKWVKQEISDKEHFMDSNRLAFKASHPMFIKYLEEHGLTDYEINYLCLYAIGLKGKEVGNYMQLRRHYNMSSEIRSKLGIDEHETNIGIYVRKLLKQL